MKYRVTIKAEGDNGSGKSFLLDKIKDFLRKEGFKINDSSLKNNHEIVVMSGH